jgi:hypothetical protein
MSDLVFESTTTMDQSSFAVWVEARPAHDEHHYELLSGRIVMTPPAGWPHGNVEARLVTRMTLAAQRGTPGAADDVAESGLVQVFTLGDDARFDAGRTFDEHERWDSAVLPGLSLCAALLQPQ